MLLLKSNIQISLLTEAINMIRFESDYSEGAHQSILDRLIATNNEQTSGYSEDKYCENARKIIRSLCNKLDASVHFFVGGTQTNLTFIASALKPYQGVIAAISGHINTHETGAIEATGHRIITTECSDGKINAQQIENIWQEHWQDPTHEHIVQPAMVYISQPTECGTVYTLSELESISSVCKRNNLLLYVDGARLSYSLVADVLAPDLTDLARLCDAFYIGGTKTGALFGEALVISNPEVARDFRYMIKRQGGLLAKGRLLGLQFEALLSDNLYLQLADHAVKQAMRIRQAFTSAGYELLFDSPTNQQFPILPDEMIARLAENFAFHRWQKMNARFTAVRFCTSWTTPSEHVDQLIRSI
jgi:threonine aldolase